jgi:acid phosphatase
MRVRRISPLFLPVLAACAGVGSTTIPGPVGGAPAANAVRPFGHVLILVEENNDYSGVIGNPSVPYLNELAAKYGLATQYYANTHPSIGNYFMLVTGQIITNDDSYGSAVGVDNLVRQLVSAGKTWKAYVEDLPSVGYLGLGDRNKYASRHNPLAYLSDARNDPSQARNLVPVEELAADLANDKLPNFGFIVPNLCSDAHDCPMATADIWLRKTIAPVLANPTFQKDGLLIITFDEGEGDNTGGGGRVPWIAISPARSKPAYQSSASYQHQSTLRLIEQALGLKTLLGAAASAPDMGEFFADSLSRS